MSDGESPTLVNFIALEFKEVTRGHSGIYNLTNTICDLNKCHEITASVTLDVLCKYIYNIINDLVLALTE